MRYIKEKAPSVKSKVKQINKKIGKLVSKKEDAINKAKELADSEEPSGKMQSSLAKIQLRQSESEAEKLMLQKQAEILKGKIDTAKKKEKTTKDIDIEEMENRPITILEGVMSDIHQMISNHKNFDSFQKEFFKEYGHKKVMKKTPEFLEWLEALYTDSQFAVAEADAKPGPDPYMRGLSDDEKEKKEDNMKKQADMKDDDPKAYKDLPGDKEAREKGEVKTSKHVKKYHELYGDEKNESLVLENDEGPIDDPKIETALKTKSEETGVPIGLIRVIMRRGLAAWKTGHRPGATSQQWGYARVNAFLTKGSGTWGDADKDIAKKVRDGGHDKGLKESVLNEEDTYNDYPSAAKANAQKAIDWKEKYGRDEVEAGTAVGWARAHQLAKGENLSADTVGRMSSFNRHRKNATISPDLKDTPWLDKGYVSWLIWGGDEGVDWAMATMDKLKKEESVMLPRYEEFVNEKKKSKPKSDKQKIKDLTKKQKGLSKKNKDFIEKINKMAKDDQKDPADKIESALLKSQMQQTSVDGMKIAVQKNQLALKSKLKTIKKRSKAGKK